MCFVKHIPLHFQLIRIRDLSHIWWENDPFSIADQRNLGMSMKVERSTLSQVRERFEFNKRKKEEALRNEVGGQHA